MTPTEQCTQNAFYVILAGLAAVGLAVWVWRTIRANRPTQPANANSARWDPRDWPNCDWVRCANRGTNHVTWVESGIRGWLCPGHRDEAVTRKQAVDTWDEAS